ncbi:EDC3 [[Candida] subhashii]|uniref:Enhancer of mRNA-decapping protein 3 n=1 Tax=[Candida] subhashii TaxID=561895 RepID=A0A8J5UWM9_9ASCO|nr:EDC3 [[Candida] subhashii]KAG7661729.1 EDC3 [[Candida] subhashii]
MTEFINYKVDLMLKDGTKSTGIITHVDPQQITLGNAIQSFNPQETISNLKVMSTQIADLKVVQLPPNFNKDSQSSSNKKKSKKSSQAQAQAQSNAVEDDAIVFARGGTPKSINYGNSRSNTPRIRSKALHSSAGSIDWGNEESDAKSAAGTDFDFEANLAMFDKKSVFADFQRKDNINQSDRLVGHNKLEYVNKSKKKEKYDIDEMVLDKHRIDNWENIGTTNTSHSETPVMQSNMFGGGPHKDSNVRLIRSDNLNPIALASPVQLLEIERLSTETYGITPSIMTETCATNLSQLIMNKMLGGTSRLSNKQNHNLPPLVLLLIGSARCGSRAFATGRQLTNHGVRVLAFVINNEDLDSELTKQWKLFENSGGKIIIKNLHELLDIINHQLDTPVELIIDALQGYDDHLEDIFYTQEDQVTLTNLMKWCNESQQQNKIMSLDIPSGIDGGSGTLSDDSLKLNCRWCISMGLPLSGLILAYKNGHMDSSDVLHYLIDVGIPNKVYSSKGNLRKFDKFWYCAESNIKLEITFD